MSNVTLPVEHFGAICSNLIPGHSEYRANSKYWIADIGRDATAPGGMSRKFWPRLKQNPAGLKTPAYRVPQHVLDCNRSFAIEIGHDRNVNRKGRERSRTYAVCTGNKPAGEDLYLVLAICDSAEYAIRLAGDINADREPAHAAAAQDTPATASTDATVPQDEAADFQPDTGEDEDMTQEEILGLVTGLEQATCDSDWGGAEYMAKQILAAVSTKRRAAAAKARREELEREKAWEASAQEGGSQ